MLSALGIELEKNERAQQAFHQTLLPDLVRYGASSLAEIEKRGLEFFCLQMEAGEIQDVLELARRQRLVKPIVDGHDAYKNCIAEMEWSATKRGRELKRPRALTSGAFREYVVEVSPAGPAIAQVVQLVVVFILAAPFLTSVFGQRPVTSGGPSTITTGLIVGAILFVILLSVVLYMGMTGDAGLRQAAKAWGRMEAKWPKFHAWQVNPVRPWLGLLGALLLISPVVLVLAGNRNLVLLNLPYFLGFTVLGIVHMRQSRANEERKG